MMFWVQLCVVVALLIAVGWVAVGGGGHMSAPMSDRPDPAVPDTGLLSRGDVDKVRFSVGARGYRMDEVDDVLDRLAYEIDARDRRIAELEHTGPSAHSAAAPGSPAAPSAPAGPQFPAAPQNDPAAAPAPQPPAAPEPPAETLGTAAPGGFAEPRFAPPMPPQYPAQPANPEDTVNPGNPNGV